MAIRWGWVPVCRLMPMLIVMSALGCSAGSRLSVRPENLPPRPASTPVIAASVAKINRNADALEGLTASTTVSVNQARFGGGVSGQMALERPRNFSLKLERGFGTPVVDVGSNPQEFWFWTKDSKEKAVYVGQYDAQGKLPPEVLVQPEWIVEALGMRPISAEEMDRIRIDRSRDPNLVVLAHNRSDESGRKILKRTVLDPTTNQVRQHLYYLPNDSTNPVAVVTPSNYKRFAVDGESESEDARFVELPQRIHLRLSPTREPKDQLVMDLALRDIHLNPPFTDTNREALFSVPRIPNYQVVNITPSRSEYAAQPRRASDESVRPTATLGSELKPGDPRPMNVDGASLNWKDPMPLEADLAPGASAPRGVESIVRRSVPRPPISPVNPGYPDLPIIEGNGTAPLGSGFVR
jgi:hypothetical protein